RINVDLGVNTEDDLPTENLISIYPNPASEDIKVKLEFAKPYDDVQLRLINNLGQQVMIKTLTNTITTHVESLSIRELPSGNYLLQVETNDGQRSIPVVIVK
ncbi:MAG: T9SS type A sorting domain-containing protein, partial [Saprospiraceae bacterium]